LESFAIESRVFWSSSAWMIEPPPRIGMYPCPSGNSLNPNRSSCSSRRSDGGISDIV
jgi:hypothetical protein